MSIHIIQTLLKPGYTNADGHHVVYVVSNSIKYGAFGLSIVLTLILVNKSVWKHVFAILVLFAFTPVVSFYGKTFSVGIGYFQIEFTALSLLILHFILNPELIRTFKAFLRPQELSDEAKNEKFEVAVISFQGKFEKKTLAELENIVSENVLIPEAIEAAKRLLALKKPKN